MDFRALVDQLLADYFRLDPVHATDLGHHQYDGDWPDLTDAGRAARLVFAEDGLRKLSEVDLASLGHDDAIDHRILTGALEAMRFGEGTRRGAVEPARLHLRARKWPVCPSCPPVRAAARSAPQRRRAAARTACRSRRGPRNAGQPRRAPCRSSTPEGHRAAARHPEPRRRGDGGGRQGRGPRGGRRAPGRPGTGRRRGP